MSLANKRHRKLKPIWEAELADSFSMGWLSAIIILELLL
jgi:hypothetical protein